MDKYCKQMVTQAWDDIVRQCGNKVRKNEDYCWKHKPMDNGCPKCEKLAYQAYHLSGRLSADFCLGCQLEQAEATALQAMNEVERIKQKISKEKENELPADKR